MQTIWYPFIYTFYRTKFFAYIDQSKKQYSNIDTQKPL